MQTVEEVGKETLRRIAAMRRFNCWLADLVRPFLGPLTVEVGCGSGTLTRLLLPERVAMLCLDCDRGHIAAMREYRDARIRAVEGDAADVSWTVGEEGKWDSAVCVNVLEHVADDAAALRNIHSVLSPGGRLVLYVPALPSLYGSLDEHLGHWRRYSRAALVTATSQLGFTAVVARYVNLFGILGWFLNGRVLGRSILPTGQLRLYDRLADVFRLIEDITGPPVGLSLLLVLAKREGTRP